MPINYYCLVAGLKEYTLDADTKGFDAEAIIEEIRSSLSTADSGALRDLLLFHDIENLLALRSGRTAFSTLGNYSREQIEEESKSPSLFPTELRRTISAYNSPDSTDYDDIDTTIPIERALYTLYYRLCSRSRSRFLREWGEADRNLRNLTAAFAARTKGVAVADVLVGEGDLVDRMARSSAADFGLKGELTYVDSVMSAVNDNSNLLDKEHRIDVVRWNIAEELTTFNYFDADFLLGYVERLCLVQRWAMLSPDKGRELFDRLVESLSGRDAIMAAEAN